MKTLPILRLALASSLAYLLAGFTAQAQQPRPAVPTAPSGAISPSGTKGPAANFTGTAYVTRLVQPDATYTCSAGSVRFEPGARTHWHQHPAGQILLITDGVGYYQEAGQPVRLLRKGEVVQCPPGVRHWHGASPRQAMTHIALVTNTEKGVVTWLQPVTDQEYTSYK